MFLGELGQKWGVGLDDVRIIQRIDAKKQAKDSADDANEAEDETEDFNGFLHNGMRKYYTTRFDVEKEKPARVVPRGLWAFNETYLSLFSAWITP